MLKRKSTCQQIINNGGKKICGIYILKNNITKLIYVGSSINIKKREFSHFSSLKRGKHDNYLIQKDYDIYGENSFVLEILELCSEDLLEEREQYYLHKLNTCDRNIGYNLCFGQRSGGNLGYRHPEEMKQKFSKERKGRRLTEKQKEAISKFNKGKIVSMETRKKLSIANKGKIVPIETCKQISLKRRKHNNSRYFWSMLYNLGFSYNNIAIKCNVAFDTVKGYLDEKHRAKYYKYIRNGDVKN